MPRTYFSFAGLAAIALCSMLSLNGCASTQPGTTTAMVYVKDAPPPRQTINRPPAPATNAVWIQGQWRWNGYRYVWLPGYWETRPRGVWDPGYWQQAPGGWGWVYGYWR